MMSGKDEHIKRKWLLFMIFAPGIFFIVYWLAMQPGHEYRVEKIKPPAEYAQLGEAVSVDGKSYRAFKGDIIFTDTLKFNNNVAVAEPGYVFMGLGLRVGTVKKQPDCCIINPEGRSYRPLKVDQSVVARNFGFNTNNSEVLYLFKVNSNSKYYYFQVNGNQHLTWRVTNEM